MKVNGRALSPAEIEQCIADKKLGGPELVSKYKLDDGGEHPTFTKAAFEAAKKEGNPLASALHSTYRTWLWTKLTYLANGAVLAERRKS